MGMFVLWPGGITAAYWEIYLTWLLKYSAIVLEDIWQNSLRPQRSDTQINLKAGTVPFEDKLPFNKHKSFIFFPTCGFKGVATGEIFRWRSLWVTNPYTPRMPIEATILLPNTNDGVFSTMVYPVFVFNFNFNIDTLKVLQISERELIQTGRQRW